MPVAMLLDNPAGSPELYARIRQELHLEAPAGGMVHIAGPGPQGGWRLIEVFASEDDAKQFLEERFAPALRAVGFSGQPPQPQFWPVYNQMP